MAETGYINYGSVRSNVPAELKVYYNIVTRTADSVTVDLDVGVHYPGSWSSNGCWVQVEGTQRSCNPNNVTGKYYWYASSQGNSRTAYWKRVTLPASAASTSVTLRVGFSNTAYAAETYQYNGFALTIPVGNTNAYWKNPTCTVTPGGTVGENTSSLTVSWSGAQDDQGDQILYNVEIWKNGVFTGNYVGGSGTSSTSGAVSVSADPPGTGYFFRTYCKDAASGNWVFGKQSATVTKNKLTAPSFYIDSPSRITPGETYSIVCKHGMPKNTNGNTSFTYALSAQYLTSTGTAFSLPVTGATSARVASSSFSVTMWDGTGTAPSGIYIKQSDIRAACDPSYFGTFRLILKCTNAYGSSEISDATAVLNWRYTPESPSAPTYTADSYYTLPNMEDPVFIINKHAVTWTWGAVQDPNGNPVTYLVYAKRGNDSWRKVGMTTSNTYTTPIKNQRESKTYQIKVIAQFSYGTLSPESLGPVITLHYYNAPSLLVSVLERDQNSVIVKAGLTLSTSLPDSVGSVSLTYTGLIGTTVTQTTAPPYQNAFEERKRFAGLTETSAGTIKLSYKDSVMSAILGAAARSTASVTVTPWSPLLTIREKGIGVNAVAGDFADLIAKGTVSVFGGDQSGKADGSINLETTLSSAVNFYVGAYLDSAGVLRAAQDLPEDSRVYQVQFSASGTSDGAPIRWRYMFAYNDVAKDAVFEAEYTSNWYKLTDSRAYGLDYNYLSSRLNSYVVRQNVYRGSVYSVRDAGAVKPSDSSGYLLFPFSEVYENGDSFTIEATFAWHTDRADVPTKMYAYTGCQDQTYFTKCLILGQKIVDFGKCAIVKQTANGRYYFQLNSNTYNFVGNSFINTDLIHARGTSLPESAARGTYAPLIVTSLSGYTSIGTGNIAYK